MLKAVAIPHANIQSLIAAFAEPAQTGKNPVSDICVPRQVGKLQIRKVMVVSVYHGVQALASVKTSTRAAPAWINIRAHSSTVAPVV